MDILSTFLQFWDNLHPVGVAIFGILLAPLTYCLLHPLKFGRTPEQRSEKLNEIKANAIKGIAAELDGSSIEELFLKILSANPELLKETTISTAPRWLSIFNSVLILVITISNPLASSLEAIKVLQGVLWIMFVFLVPVMAISIMSLARYLTTMDRLHKQYGAVTVEVNIQVIE